LEGTNSLTWTLLYLGIAFFLSVVLPFPIALLVLLVVLFSLNIVRAEIRLRKAGVGGIKGWYKSLSSSGFGRSGRNDYGYHQLKFSCMNCGKEHNKIACPRCGSKAVRAL
jgi:hypothetical protein